jgi:hypothetical protein
MTTGTDSLELYWIPLGADTTVVRLSGRVYETITAALGRRPRCDLYHAALVASRGDIRITVEVAPVPDDDGRERRGVVGDGPVGSALLGRWRVFRYEIRRWSGGSIPDLRHAVDSPRLLSTDPVEIAGALEQLAQVPTPVWGRDELGLGEMWNSNSVIAWTLASSGLLSADLTPPRGGRAPGWEAGGELARRDRPSQSFEAIRTRPESVATHTLPSG